MKILVLVGKGGCGKTTAIRKMVSNLAQQKTAKFVCAKDKKRFEVNKDCIIPLLYDGRLVAVSTYGDSRPDMTASYDNYKDYADVLVCASHPEGSKPYAVVTEWEQAGHQVVKIRMVTADDASDVTAERLRNELADLIRQLKEEQL